ncbi:MAG: hypothetical protein BM556_08650 [Bacteriovorax sp. MedPE-SWde]|nr:MAG: hypothetical protein BM556_08650 [Bacteriovorax sp. MedPE-SWde]
MKWLTINDYSSLKNISISTIRRYIKNHKVIWKKEEGKYFIQVPLTEVKVSNDDQSQNLTVGLLRQEVEKLYQQLRVVQEENNELKMLVKLYESDKNEKNELPEIPFN